MSDDQSSRWRRPSGRRPFDRWRLVAPSGVEVVSLRQLRPKERLRLVSPSIFTTLNMFSGLSCVLLAFRGHYREAAVLIAVSVLMDIADGFVARKVGATSPFGIQLDSLADLISFGIAPAVLIHTWALPTWPVLAWVAACLWLACAAFRLARFNVTTDPTADKRYFIGLPSPGAAAVVMATIFALDTPEIGPDPAKFALPVAISAIPAVLTGLAIAYGYVLQAPLGVLTAPLRRRLWGPESIAPPRTRLRSVFLGVIDDDGLDDPVGEECHGADAPAPRHTAGTE